jgi:hypothetical protein
MGRLFLALVAVVFASLAASASAATIPVTSNADTGAGSLRAAVTQANGTSEADTITVPPMVITLTSGPLSVNQDVTIDGSGEGQTILQGNGTQRILTVSSSAADLALEGMTLRNGVATQGGAILSGGASLTTDHVTFSANRSGGGGASGFGAAICLSAVSSTTLTIRDSTFDSNTAGGGTTGSGFASGIVDVEGSFSAGVTIQRSTFTNNKVGGGGNGANLSAGSGVVYFNTTGGSGLDATIESSTFSDNTTGGGLPNGGDGSGAVENTGPGTLRIYNSTFTRNTAGGGGTPDTDNDPGGAGFGAAISASEGTVDIVGNTFTQNKAGGGGSSNAGSPGGEGRGGAVYLTGVAATIRNNTFASNTAGGLGGAPGGTRGTGGAVYATGLTSPLTFTGNLVRGNRAAPDAFTDGFGGGLYLELTSGAHTIANSTFVENGIGSGGAAGATHRGGGLYINAAGAATASLRNLTITDNFVRNPSSSGGGIYSAGNVRIANSILADNTALTEPNTVVENCDPTFRPSSDGHNIESGTTCTFGLSTDLSSTVPLLGPLQDNGGPTLTRAPSQSPASPALDAGDNALCPPTDQRGGKRPAGSACDIGAVEITPPTIVRGAATADTTTATLPFDLDTGVASTTYHVEYGPAGGALAATAEVTVPGAADATAVSVALSDLSPGTAYQYELVATNMFGTTRSGVGLVTTAAAPPPPPSKASLNLKAKAGKVKVDKKGKFKLKGSEAGCPSGSVAACEVSVGVTAKAPKDKKKTAKLGSSKFTIAAGATSAIKGKLSKKGTKLLKRAGKIKKAKIAVSISVPGGEPTAGATKATLITKR